MARRKAKHTIAEWQGDDLLIHWFGMDCSDDGAQASWHGDRLIFHGLSKSKGWKLAEKPTAEKALQLIQDWQNCR